MSSKCTTPGKAWIILIATFLMLPVVGAFLPIHVGIWWKSGYVVDDLLFTVSGRACFGCYGVAPLHMGKGDGKKKRKKKSAGGGNGESVSPITASSPVPSPRATSNSLVPVRHQIRWAKLNKEYQKSQGAGFRQKRVRTKYRRAWDEEEIQLKAEQRKRKGQDPDWDVILNRTSTPPLVIVDGYNVIHQWSRLKKHMNKGDPARARQLLVDDLEDLSSVKRWRIEVVFDGTRRSTVGVLGYNPGRSSARITAIDQASKASISKYGVRVVFSGIGNEADAYIEARCAQAKNVTQGSLTGQLIVASDDSMIRLAGQNAGALCMGADRFVSELKALRKSVEHRVETAVARVNGQALEAPQKFVTDRPVRFGRRSVLIEDKRKNREEKKVLQEKSQAELLSNSILSDADKSDADGIPWWAQLPNTTIRYPS